MKKIRLYLAKENQGGKLRNKRFSNKERMVLWIRLFVLGIGISGNVTERAADSEGNIESIRTELELI